MKRSAGAAPQTAMMSPDSGMKSSCLRLFFPTLADLKMNTAYELKPLSPSLGVKISGLDLERLTGEDAILLNRAWVEHHVVLIRGKSVSEEAYVRFGRQFGRLEPARSKSPLASHPEVMVISNLRENGRELGALPDGELFWHYDRVHQRIPNRAGILHAIRLPSRGGETRFINMCRVYDSLPHELKARIAGLRALNTYDYGRTRAQDKKLSAETPSAVQPVVRVLPDTGERALYVSRLMTDRIVDIPEAESRELLESLFLHAESSAHVYEHAWRVDDILIWDNRCVMHARNDFPGDEPRLLKRLTVADDRPPAPG